jgi:hypothetical protein
MVEAKPKIQEISSIVGFPSSYSDHNHQSLQALQAKQSLFNPLSTILPVDYIITSGYIP